MYKYYKGPLSKTIYRVSETGKVEYWIELDKRWSTRNLAGNALQRVISFESCSEKGEPLQEDSG